MDQKEARDWPRTFPGDLGELSPEHEHRRLQTVSGGSPLESKDTIAVDTQLSQKPGEMQSRHPHTLREDKHLGAVFKARKWEEAPWDNRHHHACGHEWRRSRLRCVFVSSALTFSKAASHHCFLEQNGRGEERIFTLQLEPCFSSA